MLTFVSDNEFILPLPRVGAAGLLGHEPDVP